MNSVKVERSAGIVNWFKNIEFKNIDMKSCIMLMAIGGSVFLLHPILTYIKEAVSLSLGHWTLIGLFILSVVIQLVYCIRFTLNLPRHKKHVALIGGGVFLGGLVADLCLAAIIGSSYRISISSLTVIIYLMIFGKLYLEFQKEEHENQLKEEVAFIRGQINPHFVFNALNTVVAISRFEEEEARDLLVTISHYLRRSFDFAKSGPWIPMMDELAYLKSYLEIEKARFEERVDVVVNMDARDDYLIPKMILQPLVENALIHGALKKRKISQVQVDIREEEKLLIISIIDHGSGMTKEQIKKAFNNYSEKGICIGNMNKRLMELTGIPLEITSVPGEGTTVKWVIPKKEMFND